MFKFKSRFTKDNDNDDNVNVEIVIPLRYLSNFCETLEMLLINCETLSFAKETALTCAITDTKICVPVVTLSTQGKAKIL